MGDGQTIMSDIIEWQGNDYRIAYLKPWQVNGYYWAMAVKI
jgi:hypothetical protein